MEKSPNIQDYKIGTKIISMDNGEEHVLIGNPVISYADSIIAYSKSTENMFGNNYLVCIYTGNDKFSRNKNAWAKIVKVKS